MMPQNGQKLVTWLLLAANLAIDKTDGSSSITNKNVHELFQQTSTVSITTKS